MTRTGTTVVGSGSRQFHAVEEGWFNSYVSTELGEDLDCFVTNISYD